MLKFLLKGLMRDRSRSLLPVIVVTLGVMITVFMHAYLSGVLGESLEKTADFSEGHVKVETKAYADNLSQLPNDLALVGVDTLVKSLERLYPEYNWVRRIDFGGLLDVPDSAGNTKMQGAVMGKGLDLLQSDDEATRMGLKKLLVKGRFPSKAGEVLVSDELLEKLHLRPGDRVTLISSTMFGEMAIYNFTVAGSLHFGINLLDRGMMIVDIHDVQMALNMEDASGAVLGFFKNNLYNDKHAVATKTDFNKRYKNDGDKFAPVMSSLSENGLMGFSYTFVKNIAGFIILIFIFAMSIVLWNAGLISGLRRYGEFGLRMAIGEEKSEIYRSLIGEAALIGIIGTITGTILGLSVSWLMQEYGINMESIMKSSSLMISDTLRAQITPTTWFIGLVPGIISTVIGAALSGIGIYKRQTANLFKELQN
ncbi:MAG TPA: FtsX-like permease family protein [Petrimonas sp.]|uniref:ABC transporter permease n=1 Tax=Petrimonas sp. TaxID=2023866 RepID=UPI0009653081|nr:MAG: hypothetical protein BGO33_05060 [Bacteroidia bacterium 43-41]HHV85554.1 FtsX-like permease family protein [Petrimonas sp.]